MQSFITRHQSKLETLFVFLLAAVMRLTSLNVFRAIDEEDRWAWAVDFYRALLAGDLPATLVGDGYPGIFPVWLETLWLFAASIYRSILQGGWLGDDGIYLLIHEWNRTAYQGVQRFPVALTNTLLVVVVFLYTRKLFGRWVGLLAAALICLDPFYLSDSRVNRAEGLLTGLMTVSLLALIAALSNQEAGISDQDSESKSIHNPQLQSPKQSGAGFTINYLQLALSAVFGGLALLTKSQALVLLPMFAVISLIWHWRSNTLISQSPNLLVSIKAWLITMVIWVAGAIATFIILWPASWTVPSPTFSLMFNYLTRKVGEEGVKMFFLGRTILDEDPGLLFYPVIFILRTTPVMLVGLIIGLWQLIKHLRITHQTSHTQKSGFSHYFASFLDSYGIWALIAYVTMYVAGMSLGSHKQDRFLMAVFPSLYILASLAYVQLVTHRNWTRQKIRIGGAALLAIQLVTALPFHPYYFSYFNPLVGGGPVAAQLTRIGWGEGMNEVADYLQAQENPEQITVATRWFKYLTGFTGQRINLNNDGDWTRADKIIFYIQQEQRMLDPSPGIIRYFQQHVPPEEVITINRIRYATVYPNPIQYAATPLVDTIKGEMSLFGYSWDENGVRLYWENLGEARRPIAVRLWANADIHSDWLTCTTVPGFETNAGTPGEVVESDCPLEDINLSPGLYDLQVGLQQSDESWLPLDFAAGWSAVEVEPNGNLQRVSAEDAFAQLARENVPKSATPLEHLYAGRVRLLAFELTPEHPQPDQPLTVTLYWQAQRILDRNAHTSLQAFVGDNRQVAVVNTSPDVPTNQWHPGEVVRQEITLDLPPDLLTPSLLRLDVSLFPPETGNPVPVTNLQGQDIPGEITTIRLEPEQWPEYTGSNPLNIKFGESVTLTGFEIDNQPNLILYWRSDAPLGQNLTAFVHLLDQNGTLIAQSDVSPQNGLYPTSAWQPGEVILSYHNLDIQPDLPPGDYILVAGLYNPTDFTRLPATDESGNPVSDNAAPIEQVTLP